MRFAGVLAALCLWPSVAGAMTLITDTGVVGPQPYQGWLDRSYAPLPDETVTLHETGCPGGQVPACATPGEIWFDPTLLDAAAQVRVFLHEVGHQFDYTAMTPASRQAAQFLRNDQRPWKQGPNAGNERFAEAWMVCATIPRLRHRRTFAYRYAPTPALHRSMCRLIRWAARGLFDG